MLNPGFIIGSRYEIISLIGRGGMAKVYKAKDTKLNRLVAIKILNDEYVYDMEFVDKFLAEARAAARITNPNIVNVYDVSEDGDIQYIVMELVEGITLKKYIDRKGRLNFTETCKIALQIALGLEAAHNNNIIHRDVKPQNIVISKTGVVKVADFGIARASNGDTINSNVVGSVHYIAPEQARSGYSDEKSDIYSLGITMYEMITGKLPFDSDNNVSIAISHMETPIVPPSELVEGIPLGLEQIILKATQKNTINRYQSIHDFILDLRYIYKNPDAVIDDSVYDDYDSEFNDINDTVFFDEAEEKEIRDYRNKRQYEDYDENYDDEEYNEVVDPKIKKIMNILTIVGGAIVVLLLLFIIVKLGFSGKSDPDKEVPNLVGLKLDEAKHIAKNGDFRINVEGYDKEAPREDRDKIMSQDPKSGSNWGKGDKVINVIIAGTDEIKLPDFSGRPINEVTRQITELGFEFEVKEIYDDNIEKKNVVKTNPPAYSMLPKGKSITVYVSKGVESIVMVNVIGWNKDDAIKEIKRIGLVPNIEEVNGDKDKVLETSIAAGKNATRGSVVTLKVGNGKKEKTIPNIIGDTRESAIKELTRSGIKYNEEYIESDEEDGIVLKTVPEVGSKLEEDKELTLIISKKKKEDNISVPELVGKSKSTAMEVLRKLGLSINVLEKQDSTFPAGYVIDQDIVSGTLVKRGEVVTIIISKGKKR